MPHHNPNKYIKFNSLAACIQDDYYPIDERDAYDGYEDIDRFQVFNRIIPFALILYSEEEKKFIFQTNLKDVCPQNTSPKYLLVQLQDYCDFKLAFIKLGQLGFFMDRSKFIILKYVSERSEIRKKFYSYRSSLLSVQEYSNSGIELYISDCEKISKLKIDLCQEDILKTEIKYKRLGSSLIPTQYGLINFHSNPFQFLLKLLEMVIKRTNI